MLAILIAVIAIGLMVIAGAAVFMAGAAPNKAILACRYCHALACQLEFVHWTFHCKSCGAEGRISHEDGRWERTDDLDPLEAA